MSALIDWLIGCKILGDVVMVFFGSIKRSLGCRFNALWLFFPRLRLYVLTIL